MQLLLPLITILLTGLFIALLFKVYDVYDRWHQETMDQHQQATDQLVDLYERQLEMTHTHIAHLSDRIDEILTHVPAPVPKAKRGRPGKAMLVVRQPPLPPHAPSV